MLGLLNVSNVSATLTLVEADESATSFDESPSGLTSSSDGRPSCESIEGLTSEARNWNATATGSSRTDDATSALTLPVSFQSLQVLTVRVEEV